jgi:hypothetical protein
MDMTFLEGAAAVVSAIIVFMGSIWLLLTMVLGARLAYFIVASVALGFLVIMGIVWSLPAQNPLGPVGTLPDFEPIAIAESPDEIDFGPASSYPEGDWRAPNEDDVAEQAKAAELENGAVNLLDTAVDEGRIESFEDPEDAVVDGDSVRLLTEDGTEYGMVTFEPVPGVDGGNPVALLRFDPGNPLGPARMITAGTAVLWIAHLFGLGRAERRAARERAEAEGGNS